MKEITTQTITDILNQYTCHYQVCLEDGSSYPLVDALTPPNQGYIKLGQKELEMLADFIAGMLVKDDYVN